MALGERSAAIPGAVARSLAHAAPRSFWLDEPDAPEPLSVLAGRASAGLAWSAQGSPGCANKVESSSRPRRPRRAPRRPDLLAGADTERTRLAMVRSEPVPLPPEPLRSAVIGMTGSSRARADRNDDRRHVWLRLLDRLGLSFDS